MFLVATTFSSEPAFGDIIKIRKTIIKIAHQLEEINRFDCEAIGLAGQKPESFKLYEKLTANATAQELIQLAEHDNAVVQCYSIKALGERNSVDLLPILLSQLANTKNIIAMCGCFQQTKKVFDYVYSQIEYHEKNGNITLNDHTKDQIYRIILYNDYSDYIAYLNQFRKYPARSNTKGLDNTLASYRAFALDNVLLNIEPKQAYYKRIRQVAMDSISKNAIIALAKYQQQADIPLIKKYYPTYHIHDTYLNAISEFPDPGFIDDLFTLQLQYLDKEFCRAKTICKYYTVLLQYKNQQSIEIIKYGLKNMRYTKNRNCHLEALYAALEIFPDPYYDDIKSSIPISQKQKDRIEKIVEDYKETD